MEALTEAVASSLTKALDQVGEAPGLLRRREVATGKLGGLDRIAEPLPSQAQLPCLESVLAAADDVETHFSPEFRDKAAAPPGGGLRGRNRFAGPHPSASSAGRRISMNSQSRPSVQCA
jgi:hypothetical protein